MDFKIIHIEETDSTNRWLKAHGEGTMVVVADYQTAGKGCGTNSWESERGKNLTFSMLIHPTDIPASQQFRITEVVSVALCEVLEQYIGDVSIKWPNDIYMGDKKICGVLIENRLQGNVIVDSIIGIGLNVNQTEFVSDAPNPVSLRQLLGREIDREALLHDFLETLETVSSSETTYSAYRNKLFRMGKQAVFSDETGRFEGTIQDVETDGRLLIKDLSGQARRYAFKEVQFVI
jgi:BirA family biotin operon repressor/biotin-[acetyl-CoA-carboxylase] ligase